MDQPIGHEDRPDKWRWHKGCENKGPPHSGRRWVAVAPCVPVFPGKRKCGRRLVLNHGGTPDTEKEWTKETVFPGSPVFSVPPCLRGLFSLPGFAGTPVTPEHQPFCLPRPAKPA